MTEQFRRIHTLRQRDHERAVVGADQDRVYLGLHHAKAIEPQALTPWTVAEARQLRDWLTQALPCEHKGQRSGTIDSELSELEKP